MVAHKGMMIVILSQPVEESHDGACCARCEGHTIRSKLTVHYPSWDRRLVVIVKIHVNILPNVCSSLEIRCNRTAMKTGHNKHRSVEQVRQDEEETTDTMSNVGLVMWKRTSHGMDPSLTSVLPHKKKSRSHPVYPRSFAMVVL